MRGLLFAIALLAGAATSPGSDDVRLPAVRRPALDAWLGTTPTVDGRVSDGEYADAAVIEGVAGWVAQFSPTRDATDLSLRGWVKHDGARLYFAFDVTDDVLYGIDTARWLPKENPRAHELSRRGYPWFGDEMEVLLNARGTWAGDGNAEGSGASWQMVCNLTKSRLGGVGKGGALEGEPRSDEGAWNTYKRWIESGAQVCEAHPKAEGRGYVIEWSIAFDPCVEVEVGKFWSPAMGPRQVGLNLAVGDLDRPEDGEGNFGNFHHEDWWAGARGVRTQLRHFGWLTLQPGMKPSP